MDNQSQIDNKYIKYDQRTHVYNCPNMYIGSDVKVPRKEYLYDFDTNKMFTTMIDFVPGCEHLFLEVLMNSSDNIIKSRKDHVSFYNVKVQMDNQYVSVKNYGIPIDVIYHSKYDLYIPELLFGNLLTSVNYETEREGAGVNGIGIKAVNIFSTVFQIKIKDAKNKKFYVQTWKDNMRITGKPKIKDYEGDKSSVKVIYQLDFEKFGYNKDEGYNDTVFQLFAKHCLNLSFTNKVKVLFNNIEFDANDLMKIGSYYCKEEEIKNSILFYKWNDDEKTIKKKNGVEISMDNNLPSTEAIIIHKNNDDNRQVSFVNCIPTFDGGKHIDCVSKATTDCVANYVNSIIIKKINKYGKGKSEKDLKSDVKKYTINQNNIKSKIFIIVSAWVSNPKFKSQTKSCCISLFPKINFDEIKKNEIFKWSLIKDLQDIANNKQLTVVNKVKKNSFLTTHNLLDANKAGTKERSKCTLYLTEGQSGGSLAKKLIESFKTNYDYNGIFYMKGKCLNVMNSDPIKIENNVEFKNLKEALGLIIGMDYSIDKNQESLRYGKVIIMADSDLDGKHIIGLILNFFHCLFPELLKNQYVKVFKTPIIKCFKGKNVVSFYTLNEYKEWSKNEEAKNYVIKYYKGLGSSSDKDIQQNSSDKSEISFIYDDDAKDNLQLAFDKHNANKRKNWIINFKNEEILTITKEQLISEFINKEMIYYSIDNLQRSIPKLMDGFKESHRKIVRGSFLHWNIKIDKPTYKEFKVGQFGHFIADKVNYHHGEMIISKVITCMAQNFTGSNNIPLFQRKGQFGTRFESGNDAANPRYTFTKPENIFAYIFRKEDNIVLNPKYDESMEIEPKCYYPIIPILLINGTDGIATGFRTFIPSYNPIDIIEWLKNKLQNKELKNLVPWYHDFKGIIKIEKNNNVKLDETLFKEVDENENENENISNNSSEKEYNFNTSFKDKKIDYSLIVKGKYKILSNDTIQITELPIGINPSKYLEWLKKLRLDKKIKKYKNNCVGNNISFEIKGFNDDITYENLRIIKKVSMNNMVALDKNDKPVKYCSVSEILKSFYSERLKIYKKRKNILLQKLQNEYDEIKNKMKFLKLIINREIKIINRKKDDIKNDMNKYDIPNYLLDKIKLSNLSEDDLENLDTLLKKKEKLIDELEQLNIKTMWFNELDELEKIYLAKYK